MPNTAPPVRHQIWYDVTLTGTYHKPGSFSSDWAATMQDTSQRQQRAAAELAARVSDRHPGDVVDSLTAGLTQLAGLLDMRLQSDVEQQFGLDTMVSPLSRSQAGRELQRADVEIDAYTAVVVEEEVARGRYVADVGAWFLDWMLQLRRGDEGPAIRQSHAEAYRALLDRPRRLRFASQLQRAVPESVRMPGVILKLYALSVRSVAALAFGDAARAEQLRAEQIELLPAIADCRDCKGRVLMNGAGCRTCGNPLWTYAWLRAD
jgi:hypothetical protein